MTCRTRHFSRGRFLFRETRGMAYSYKSAVLLWSIQALLTDGGCSNGDDDSLPDRNGSSSPFHIQVDLWQDEGAGVTITHASNPERAIWETIPGKSFVSAAIAEETITQNGGALTIRDTERVRCEHQTVDQVVRTARSVSLPGRLSGTDCDAAYSLVFTPLSDNQLGFHLRLVDAGPEYNRVFLRYASSPDERFFGFGEQFSRLDTKERRLPIFTREQGVGRFDAEAVETPVTMEDVSSRIITSLVNLVSPDGGGTWYSTYAPVPYYMTSKGRSLFLENDEVSVFDMEGPDEVEIKLFGPDMRGRILNGNTPLERIEEYTAYTGRMSPLPDWMSQGAIVGLKGGTAEVYHLERAELVRITGDHEARDHELRAALRLFREMKAPIRVRQVEKLLAGTSQCIDKVCD